MKLYKLFALSCVALGGMTSCNDFIDVPPPGVVDGDLAYSQPD